MDVLSLFRLDGNVAVVTGGGTGIGRAIAHGLASAGADVVVAGRRSAPLEQVSTEIREEGRRALAVSADVTVAADLRRLGDAALATFGHVSIWVNNAGGLQGEPMGTLPVITEDSWHTIVDRNFTSI